MSNSKSALYIPIIFFFLVCPVTLFGQTQAIPKIPARAEGKFVLTVENDLLSLKAQEASLRAILAEIGHKMRIEVVGEIPAEDTLTAEFHHLRLEQALHRLSSNYGYQMKKNEGQQNVAKIFLLPKGSSVGLPNEPLPGSRPREEPEFQISEHVIESDSAKKKEPDKEKPSRSQPFKFEFDPSASLK
ncbi:MAG: hypothetical protein ABI618_03330 [Nitrospirota bacterium]